MKAYQGEKRKHTTIDDIAKMARVSTGTVSRAINKSGYVAQETRERIMKAIEETEFSPNSAARALKMDYSRIVGVIVPEIENPGVAQIFVKLEENLVNAGFTVLLCHGISPKTNRAKLKNFLRTLSLWKAYGLICFVVNINKDELAFLKKQNFNIVTIMADSGLYDAVDVDDYHGYTSMVNYLIDCGHKRIYFFGTYEGLSGPQARYTAYIDTMRKRGLDCPPDYVVADTGQAVEKIVDRWLARKNPPTAICLTGDFYSIGTYSAILKRGLTIGRDISVCGFDNIAMSRFLSPPLTTIGYDYTAIAHKAVELLLRQKSENDEPMRVVFPTELIIRESTSAIHSD